MSDILANPPRVALTIAGSDSIAGAGIQADLKTFAALGVYGATVVTAVTAQSTKGVSEAAVLSADLVTAQIEAVAGDVELHAVKTGMLGDAAVVEAVAAAIKELDLPLVVVDPVLASSAGARLLDDDGLRMLCAELLPVARVVTPNIPEAEVLSGIRIESEGDLKDAARRIHELGAASVVITGGHRTGVEHTSEVKDVLFDGRAFSDLVVRRVEGPEVHGTGCTYAAAVAAYLALGYSLVDAASRAQQFVAIAIRESLSIGQGARVLNHFGGGILKR